MVGQTSRRDTAKAYLILMLLNGNEVMSERFDSVLLFLILARL
jgi:hypothetical protein